MAERSGFAIVFDKAGDITMLYTNAKYDKSNDVLEILGWKKPVVAMLAENNFYQL